MLDRASELPPTVVISNGFSKFEVDYSAEEARRAGRLERYLTGAYPTRFWRNLLKGLGENRGASRFHRGIGRFLDRETRLPDSCIASFPLPEFFYLFVSTISTALKLPGDALDRPLLLRSFKLYGNAAARVVARISPRAGIYHYRSGFGGISLAVARAKGMVLLCEHSIADPRAVDYLVCNGGRLPPPGSTEHLRPFWQYIADEIAVSDFVVANSDFVKQTMVAMGHEPDKIFVLCRGTDDKFISLLDNGDVPSRAPGTGPLRLLFAGSFSRRKGAKCLRAAMDLLTDTEGWALTIAGPVENESAEDYSHLTANPRVRALGPLSRIDLARAMRQADVFVFPSLAEGSARVVFEALAAGCYVVTTPNSGSVVGRDADGVLVEPENPSMLAKTIAELIADRDRVLEGGAKNAALVRKHYRQSAYGEKLIALYDSIAAPTLGDAPQKAAV